MCAKPTPGGKTHEVFDDSLEEIHNIFVLDILGPVARKVEGAEAGGVLAELMAPESGVRGALGRPKLGHIVEKVMLAKGTEEGIDSRPIVGGYGGSGRCSSGRIGRRGGVILS